MEHHRAQKIIIIIMIVIGGGDGRTMMILMNVITSLISQIMRQQVHQSQLAYHSTPLHLLHQLS
jgi:hypothetical protein